MSDVIHVETHVRIDYVSDVADNLFLPFLWTFLDYHLESFSNLFQVVVHLLHHHAHPFFLFLGVVFFGNRNHSTVIHLDSSLGINVSHEVDFFLDFLFLFLGQGGVLFFHYFDSNFLFVFCVISEVDMAEVSFSDGFPFDVKPELAHFYPR